jgi:hypothetical protein
MVAALAGNVHALKYILQRFPRDIAITDAKGRDLNSYAKKSKSQRMVQFVQKLK